MVRVIKPKKRFDRSALANKVSNKPAVESKQDTRRVMNKPIQTETKHLVTPRQDKSNQKRRAELGNLQTIKLKDLSRVQQKL